ncbi:MAG: antibiotic biosynthesis monooxygenase [Endozoicomonadaceae bacterium]|nr:antibiotic biosynthesis monooxygenase [Endozoicomonadaceae bacterium]MCY4329711.1 antibiotic biosynthesis monooxygenase [Endozoicomonadaceae bacterium]
MFVVANRIPLKDEWLDAFEERFNACAEYIKQQPGFIQMIMLRPDKANDPHVIMTTWQSKAAFEYWMQSENFKLTHRNPMPEEAFSGMNVIEYHEISILIEKKVTYSEFST